MRGTTAENLADNQVINILGNAALEGADKPGARFTNRNAVRQLHADIYGDGGGFGDGCCGEPAGSGGRDGLSEAGTAA